MGAISKIDGELLAQEAYLEFSDALDYVWKTPRLIESETKLELEKLESYFPITGDADKDALARKLRAARWRHESNSLSYVFPRLMAVSNLFASCSLFEIYCLRLCKKLERHSIISLANCKGSGVSRLYKFMELNGIVTERVMLRQEVKAVIAVRNCLYHANGLLTWSREEAYLRNIVRAKS